MIAHACNPNTQEVEQENKELKANLNYLVSLRPTQAMWIPVSNNKH